MMRALDLFCGGGGAAYGLLDAGFDVTGIDCVDHSRAYPGNFILGDALRPPVALDRFDFIWASPPCQAFSPMGYRRGCINTHPNFVSGTVEILRASGVPYAIENVPQAVKGGMRADLTLEGTLFGLTKILRRRIFELSFPTLQPPLLGQSKRVKAAGEFVTITTSMCASTHYYTRKARGLPGRLSTAEAKAAMGIPQSAPMNAKEIGESIPPAYSEYIGRLAVGWIERRRKIQRLTKAP